MNKIMIDLDDTVGDIKHNITKALSSKDKNVHHSELYTYNLTEIFDIERDDLLIKMKNAHVLEKMFPKKSAIEVINELYKTYYIHIVTARGWHDNGRNITEKWLDLYGLKYHKLDVTPHLGDKSTVLDGEYKYSFDDSVKNCSDLLNSGKVENVILMSQPWNAKDSLFTRHDCWEKIYDMIREN